MAEPAATRLVEPGASEPLVLVMTTVGDDATAERIAQALVDERLAACVNLLVACRSVYRWRGAVEQATEVPLLIKTRASTLPAMAQRLRELHPYEVPEIVAWQPQQVGADYLAWALAETAAVADSTGAPPVRAD